MCSNNLYLIFPKINTMYMNKKLPYIIGLTIIMQWTVLSGQRTGTFGVGAGTGNYHGEMNQGKLFNAFSTSLSAFYNINLNKRYTLRPVFTYTKLVIPNLGTKRITEFSGMFDMSYFDFVMMDRKKFFTPYITAGVGIVLAPASNSVVVPFGMGGKLSTSRRLTFGGEFLFHKLFTDNLDGLSQNEATEKLKIHNNDYYSTLKIFITYKFFKFADDCPVY